MAKLKYFSLKMYVTTLLFVLFFAAETLAQYAAVPAYPAWTTSGGGQWGSILKISCRIYGSDATFYIEKKNGTNFGAGTMYLKVGTFESWGVNKGEKNVNGEKRITFNLNLLYATNYPKEFYARFESSVGDGGEAWTGPIVVSGPPTVTSVTPNKATLGEKVTFTIKGQSLTNEIAWYIPDFGSGTVDYSSNTTQKTFSATATKNNGTKSGEIKDEREGKILKYFTVDVSFPKPTGFSATAKSESEIHLRWNAVEWRDHYELKRSANATGPYFKIYSGTKASYTDENLNDGTTYYYKVQACQDINENSCSDLTNYVSATTLKSNTQPILSQANVTPSSGRVNTNFSFEVKYYDSDYDVPDLKQVWIDKDNNGSFGSNEKLTMSHSSGSAANGIYKRSETLSTVGNIKYEYHFRDGSDLANVLSGTVSVTEENSDIQLTGLSPNQTIMVGENYTLSGTVTSNENLTVVTAAVSMPDGEIDATTLRATPNTKSYNLKNFTFTTPNPFNQTGKYTVGIWAKDASHPNPQDPLGSFDIFVTGGSNTAPILSEASVTPNTGLVGTNFSFNVKYNDSDGDSPVIKKVWIDVDGNGNYNPQTESFTMSLKSGSYYNGTYQYFINLNVAGVIKYKFDFSDGTSPANVLSGTVSVTENNNNNPPILSNDLVNPKSGKTGTNFSFLVDYLDIDNDEPVLKQIWIDENNNNNYETNEKLTMDFRSGSSYYNGTYGYSKILNTIGNIKYEFHFSDGSSPANKINGVVEVKNEDIKSIFLGQLECKGDVITKLSESTYRISGNANINNILFFNGELNVNIDNLTIESNSLIYIKGIPKFGEVQLYRGAFSFDVKDNLMQGTLSTANNLFSLGNLPVNIDNISLLNDGIQIEGKLELPEIMGKLKTEINTLQITKSNGIDLAGGLEINSVRFKGFELKDMSLSFNTITDVFEGEGTLVTSKFSITAGTKIDKGRLDEVRVWVELGKPIALGATGLSLKAGGGKIKNIANPPMELSLGVSLVSTFQGSFDIVKFDNLNLAYTFGTEIRGSGAVLLFNNRLASAEFSATTNSIMIKGDVNIADVLLGFVSASLYKANSKLNFEGELSASLVIPNKPGFPFGYVGTFVDLPKTIAKTQNKIKNAHIWGFTKFNAWLLGSFILTYDVEWKNSQLIVDWGGDYSLYNGDLFESNYLLNDLAMQSKNRFEGRSLIINRNALNKRLKGNSTKLTQLFTLSKSTPSLIIRLKNNGGDAPDYDIKLPNGMIVTKDNVTSFPDIFHSKNEEQKKGFYQIVNPELGNYELIMDNSNEYSLDVFGAITPSNIKLGTVLKNGNNININWAASDPENISNISLYYDTDNFGTDGVMIAENISPKTSNYVWNAANLATGNYYIYATIQDNHNPPVASYADRQITHIIQNAPIEPKNLNYSLTDTSIVLTWEKQTSEPMDYNIYYSTTSQLDFNSNSYNLGNLNQFEFTNMDPGKTYLFAVSAIDTYYRESDLSNIISLSFLSATKNNAPTILEQKFPPLAFVNSQLRYQINTFDADGDPISYSLKTAPQGLAINGNGNLTWNPTYEQIGNNLISLIISDNQGGKDSVDFRIEVLEKKEYLGNVKFDKPIYFSYNEKPIIILDDINLNSNSSIIDSHFVKISSKKEPEGISVLAKETSANSGIFNAFINLTNGNGSFATLGINSIDSLICTYEDNQPTQKVTTISYFIDTVVTDIKETEQPILKQYFLDNSYPNPFNPTTTIQFNLPENADVKLIIYNSLGEEVKQLIDSKMRNGNHFIQWNGTDKYNNRVSSGVYFYRFVAKGNKGSFVETKKMILIK